MTVRPDPAKGLLAAALIVHAVFLVSLFTGWLNPLFVDGSYRVGRGADFYSLYQAGRNFLDGVDIYDWFRQTVVPYGYAYRYVPFQAMTLGVAFQLVPAPTAYAIWVVLLEAMLVLNIRMTRRIAPGRRAADVATALWLLSTPYYLELYMGQFSFFMITIVLWSLYFWRGKPLWAGDVLWVLSLVVKSFSVLFAAILMRQKRWVPIVTGAIVSLGLTVPYFVGKPVSQAEFYYWNIGGLNPFMIGGNQGPAALLAAMVVRAKGLWPHAIAGTPQSEIEAVVMNAAGSYGPWLLGLAVVAVSVGLWVNFRSPGKDPGPLVLFWIVTYFVFFKTTWEHQYVMLIPVFVLMYLSPGYFSGPGAVPRGLFWAVFAVIAAPTPLVFLKPPFPVSDPEFAWTWKESLCWHLGKPVATVALWIFMIRRLLAAPVEMVPFRVRPRSEGRRSPARRTR